jgi:hypothetical protein
MHDAHGQQVLTKFINDNAVSVAFAGERNSGMDRGELAGARDLLQSNRRKISLISAIHAKSRPGGWIR